MNTTEMKILQTLLTIGTFAACNKRDITAAKYLEAHGLIECTPHPHNEQCLMLAIRISPVAVLRLSISN